MKTLYSMLLGVLLLAGISVQAQTAPKMVNGGVVNGKATSLPKPEYPDALRNAGIEGLVGVNVTIGEDGSVILAEADLHDQRVRKAEDGTVIEGAEVDPQLRAAAEHAARSAKFSPTFLSGAPVQVKGKIVYNFVAGSASAISTITKSEPVPGTINGGVLNGKASSLPLPEYPAAAKAVSAGGAVSIQVVIDEDGNVTSAKAVSGHPLLRAAAETAAMGAKFAPTRLAGNPVKVSGVLTYNFVP